LRTAAEPATTQAPPTWTQWDETFRVIFYPPFFKKTVQIALVVGTVLFAINHPDEVIHGRATLAVWIKAPGFPLSRERLGGQPCK